MTCPVNTSAPDRRRGNVTAATPLTALGTVCWPGRSDADAAGDLDWNLSVDGTINRAHQHATNTTRPDQDTGDYVKLQESARFGV